MVGITTTQNRKKEDLITSWQLPSQGPLLPTAGKTKPLLFYEICVTTNEASVLNSRGGKTLIRAHCTGTSAMNSVPATGGPATHLRE